ncbi:MAG: hypothetical protein ABIP97_00160 [Chthoniobacterales bacterium]
MIAIIWKELRENIKWGLLGLAVFGIALAYAWTKVADMNNFTGIERNYQSLLSPTILLAISLTSAIVGGALGFLQIMPEQKRDRWAFLVHRPVSLETIFWGKFAAGFLLYFGATLLPFAALYLVAARPGALPAPFDPRMALAGFVDILAGFTVYLAALISSLRTGRWLGSKLLVIAGAVLVMGVISNRMEILYSVLWFICYSIIFLIAARGMISNQGLWNPLRKVAKITFFVVTLLGCVQLLSWSLLLITGLFSSNNVSFSNGSRYSILKDGTPIAVEYKNGIPSKVLSLDGKDFLFTREQMARLRIQTLDRQNLDTSPEEADNFSYREIGRYVLPSSSSTEGQWYYSLLGRQFMLYNCYSKSTKCIGILTPSGYVAAGENSDSRFPNIYPGMGNISSTPIFNNKVYYIDTLNLTTSLIYTAKDKNNIYQASTFTPVISDDLNIKIYFIISLAKKILVLDKKKTTVIALPWAHDKKIWSNVGFSMMRDESACFTVSTPSSEIQSKNNWQFPIIIDKYNTQGQLLKSWNLKDQPEKSRPIPWHFYAAGAITPIGWYGWQDFSYWVGAKLKISSYQRMWAFTKTNWRLQLTLWKLSLLSSVISFIAAFWVLRRKGLSAPTMAAWLLVVTITGIAGFLAMLAVPEFPNRISCPSCGKKRRVEAEECEHCEKPWPLPVKDGTEIFAMKR